MTEPDRSPSPLQDARWFRDRSPRTGLPRAMGLALLLAIVVGAVAVRAGGGGGSAPSLYTSADTAAAGEPARAAPETGGAPADSLAREVTAPGTAGAPADSPGPEITVPGDRPDATSAADDSTRLVAPAPVPSPVSDLEPDPDPDADLEPDPEPDAPYVPPTPPDGWAEAAAPSPRTADPVPDSLRVPKPDAVRGVYVGSWTAGDPARLVALLALADATEINAFVVDIKDVTGEVSYRTEVPLAVQVEAERRIRIGDVRALLDTLRAHGIYAIARVVAFKDPLLAVARPEWSVEGVDGEPWEDNRGVRWVDSFNRDVWDYNIELAREAVALGFGEVQWDYVRFPDVPRTYTVEAVYPARGERTKTEAIREFLGYAAGRLPADVPMTADVFGITTSTQRDIGIGQVWEAMSDRADVLLPMVYPSHYPAGSWGYPNPNAAPYQIVKSALDAGVERSRLIDGAAAIRPWLQAFSLGEPPYGPRHIRAQIDATYDAGLTEWVLWHPAVRYPIEAFTDANGIEPWFAGMGEALYEPADSAPPDRP